MSRIYVSFLPPSEPGDPWLCGIYQDGELAAVGQGGDREAAERQAREKFDAQENRVGHADPG